MMMNASTASRISHLVRSRCLRASSRSMMGNNSCTVITATAPIRLRALATMASRWPNTSTNTTTTTTTPITTTTTTVVNPSIARFFASDSGNGGSGDNDKENSSSSIDATIEREKEDEEKEEDDKTGIDLSKNPPTYSELAHDYTDDYNPFEIVKSFEDTSYYYPPSEEMDPKFLAARYEGMTNEELLDSGTIRDPSDPERNWDGIMHSPPVRDKNAALPKGTLVGRVVSTKMQKTVNVAVDRYRVHPKYRKRIRYTRKFMAHDEHEVASDGDLVLIVPSQRISKKKHFVLREILKAKGQL